MEYQPPDRDRDSARQALSPAAVPTIVAAATPPGRGGIAVVRLSGPEVPDLARRLLGALPQPRHATAARFLAADGSAIDRGLALYFPAPHSYTGEDVLELQGHGGPIVVDRLVRRALELGARRAGPGEFTQRAYLHGKLDLAQAEAVAGLIDAASEAAARAAMRSLEGEFSERVRALDESLAQMRTQVEAGIDFAEEDLDLPASAALAARLEHAQAALEALQRAGTQGRMLTEGLTVVIAGLPNVGKSTLLNRLAGHESAIVTPLPGTTRDVLRERILIEGLPVQLLDTAGLRTAEDPIEVEGIRRARAAIERADRVLFVVDAAADPTAEGYRRLRSGLPASVPVTLVYNKADLCAMTPDVPEGEMPALRISALQGEGIDALRAHLRDAINLGAADEGVYAARARHLEALERAAAALAAAQGVLAAGREPELIAEELRLAGRAFGEIVGEVSSEDLLGRIFSSFCIGK